MSKSMANVNKMTGPVAVRVWYFKTKEKHTWVFPVNDSGLKSEAYNSIYQK